MKINTKFLKLFLIFAFFQLMPDTSYSGTYGKGELKLNKGAVEMFKRYVRGTKPNRPDVFIIAIDSSWYTYWTCEDGAGQCMGSDKQAVELCEDKSGKECGVFAKGRTVRWGGKKGRFKSKWSDDEVIAKLIELGFVEPNLFEATYESDDPDKIQKLKKLKALYDQGAIEEEDYNKEKKKILSE